jgi:hypothetical protein
MISLAPELPGRVTVRPWRTNTGQCGLAISQGSDRIDILGTDEQVDQLLAVIAAEVDRFRLAEQRERTYDAEGAA